MNNFKSSGGFKGRQGGGDFKRRDSRNSGGRDFNRGGGFNQPTTMYQAVCSECGQPCEVPFKPSGDRPVYCSNCFKSKDNSSPRQFGGRDFKPNFRDNARPNFRDNARPSFNDRQPFSRDEQARPDRAQNNNNSFDAQFNMLNAKIDQILRSLSPVADSAPVKAVPTVKATAKPTVLKTAVKKNVVPKKAKRK